jgi:hypothetical protein
MALWAAMSSCREEGGAQEVDKEVARRCGSRENVGMGETDAGREG